MDWLVIAYYTIGTIYENIVDNLCRTLNQFNVPNKIVAVNDLGSWQKNTQYKPKFIKQMLEENKNFNLIYVDADAEFLEYPHYFNNLSQDSSINISVLELDHNKFGRKARGLEILSGTIFLINNETTMSIVNEWIKGCELNPDKWDQVILSIVLKKYGFHNLPEKYCVIFDYMVSVPNPVIKHFQASRQVRFTERQKNKVVNVPAGHIRIKHV